jgi:hypothetical protein
MGNKSKVDFMKWIERNLPDKPEDIEEADPYLAGVYDKEEGVDDTPKESTRKSPLDILSDEEKENSAMCVPDDPKE